MIQIIIKKKQKQQKHFCSLPVPAVQIVGTAKRDVRRRKKQRGVGVEVKARSFSSRSLPLHYT